MSKMDRRKMRTRALLYKALIELMKEKEDKRITVSDLTERANINRGTFYLHYMDVDDLIEKVKAEIWKGLTQRMEKLNPYDYLSYATRNKPDPMMVKVIKYYADHADFFRIMLGPKGDPAFVIGIKEFLKTHHISKILDFQPKLAKTILPKDYMISYFAASNLSILHHWIETGMKQSPSTIALMITNILGSGVKQLYGIKGIN